MSSQCDHLGEHPEFAQRLLDRSCHEPQRGDAGRERIAVFGTDSYVSLGTGIVVTTLVFNLATVCGMSLLFQHRVTCEYLLTGLAGSLVIACVILYVGAAILREVERGRWDLIASEERIRQIAHFDAVTGLPNRILLKDRMCKALSEAARNRTPLAVLFVDLDRFKSINDTLGHHAGDEVLRTVGDRLEQSLRDVDTVARLGGDEFVILLPRTDAKGASEVAEKVRSAVAQTLVIEGHHVSVTPSIGISVCPDDGMDMEALIRNADTAMYRAKGDGSNTLRFFRPETQDATRRQVMLERNIRGALRRNEFTLLYQPQIDTRSGAIVAVTALLRWNHPERGLLSPDAFLPLAESGGLLATLGEWYLTEACSQNAAWHASGVLSTAVVIHLSGQHFKHPALLGQLQRVLLHSGLKPEQLELELTESSITDSADSGLDRLHRFKQYGIQFAINEFGTSHCSLTYLKDLPVDKLKIEPSFIHGLPRNQYDAIIVRSMIDLAHSLRMKVVADGVDSPMQLEYLRAKGCDVYQGRLCGDPLPAAAFIRSLPQFTGRHREFADTGLDNRNWDHSPRAADTASV